MLRRTAIFVLALLPSMALAQSPSGTMIPPAAQITDGTGGIWAVTPAGGCTLNGTPAVNCADVLSLLWFGDQSYKNVLANWYQWTGSDWILVTDPRGLTPPVNPNAQSWRPWRSPATR